MKTLSLIVIYFCSISFAYSADDGWLAHLGVGAESAYQTPEKDENSLHRALLYGGAVGTLGIESPTFLGLAFQARGLIGTSGGKFSYRTVKDGITYTDPVLKGAMLRFEGGLGLKFNFINAKSFKLFVGALGIYGGASIAYDPLDWTSHHGGSSTGLTASDSASYSGLTYQAGIDFIGSENGLRFTAEYADYRTKSFVTLGDSKLTLEQWQFMLALLQRF